MPRCKGEEEVECPRVDSPGRRSRKVTTRMVSGEMDRRWVAHHLEGASWEAHLLEAGTLEWAPHRASWVSRTGMGLLWAAHRGDRVQVEELRGWVGPVVAGVEETEVVLTIGAVTRMTAMIDAAVDQEKEVVTDPGLAIVLAVMNPAEVAVEMVQVAKIQARRNEAAIETTNGLVDQERKVVIGQDHVIVLGATNHEAVGVEMPAEMLMKRIGVGTMAENEIAVAIVIVNVLENAIVGQEARRESEVDAAEETEAGARVLETVIPESVRVGMKVLAAAGALVISVTSGDIRQQKQWLQYHSAEYVQPSRYLTNNKGNCVIPR